MRSIDVFPPCRPPPSPSFILLHDSLSYVRSFGCHPCASQSPSAPSIYLPSSFLPDYSLSPVSPIITSVHCEFAFRPPLPPISSFLPPHHSFIFLSELGSACLSQVWVPYFDFPTPLLLFAPPLLFLLFIYIARDGGRADRMDWWIVRGHGWGDLGVWWTLLSDSILLKKLARSLL